MDTDMHESWYMNYQSIELDDCNWLTEDIAKLYKCAAKLAGYTEEEISRFKELNNRTLMLQRLDYFRSTGWVCIGETGDVSSWPKIVKIPFCSLAELELKLTIMGAL